MRFLLTTLLLFNLVFFLGCKTTTDEQPTVSSSPSQPVEEPEEEVEEEKPQTIIVPTGSIGEISEARKKILEKTLESKLDDYFDIVPKELFEEAEEKAFEELDYEECTEDQCIMMIKEILQVEHAFQLVLILEEGDTQISLTWNDLDKKRVEEDFCEGCKTKELRESVSGLVDKLVGGLNDIDKNIKTESNLKIEQKVSKTVEGILFKDLFGGWKPVGNKNRPTEKKYEGGIRDGLPNGQGTFIDISGNRIVGEWRDGEPWNTTVYKPNGFKSGEYKNGVFTYQ